MWIDRELAPRITALARERPVVVVTGARQVGKTSLLRRLFPDHRYISLDLPSDAALAEEAPEEFLTRHPPPVLVDEVQYAPALFRHLKRYVDAHRGDRGRIVLTGSQKFVLMEAVGDSLAGRAGVLELDSLSLREIRRARPATTAIDRLVRGGLPELWADPNLDSRAFYRDYVATYLERDVRALLRVSSLRDYERFIRACALRSGGLLNKTDLARDVGISGPTAGEWLSVLQASSQVALLEPWFRNRTRSLTKTPKLLFSDTGLLMFLLNIRDAAELLASPLRGAVFETAVYGELRRALALRDETDALFFYRDRTLEVDFLRHRGGRFDLLECKLTEMPRREDAYALDQVAAALDPARVDRRLLVCRTPAPAPLDSHVRATNLESLAEDLESE